MTPTAAVLSLLSLLLAQPTASPGPFAACGATPIARGWVYDCPGTRLSLEDYDGTVTPAYVDAYLDGKVAGAMVYVGEGAIQTRSRRKVAGFDAEIREIVNSPARRFAAVVEVTVPSGTRVLGCHMGPLNRCVAILESLTRQSEWRGGAVAGATRRPSSKLSIAGRQVAAPEDCTVDALPEGGRIDCARGGVAYWASGDAETIAQGKQKFDRDLPSRAANEHATREEVPCRLEGFPTTCSRVTVGSSDARRLYLWAAAEIRGENVLAFCSAPTGTANSACSLLFQVP